MFRRLTGGLLVLMLAFGGLSLLGATSADAGTIAACTNPSPPSWWATRLQEAADDPNDSVPSSWGTSLNIARIVCRESDFNHDAANGQYYGLGQLNSYDVSTYGNFSWNSYVNGTSNNPATYYQLLAALRDCKARD